MSVPIISRNSLFYAPDDQIDAWSDHPSLFTVVRQLGALQEDQPRLVLGLPAGEAETWGEDTAQPDEWTVARRLLKVIAAGGHVNVDAVHAGTFFGFDGGRLATSDEAFLRTDAAPDGTLVDAFGTPRPQAAAVRRVCMFASSFQRVMSGADPAYQPVVISPTDESSDVTVIPTRGRQGSVVYILGKPGTRSRSVSVTLGDGTRLPLELPTSGMAWLLLDTHLFDRTTLDYSTLCAWALEGKTLVLFGRAGSTGLVSVNGAPFEVQVPKGRRVTIERVDDLTLVICSEEMVDATWVGDGAVYTGASGIDEHGVPIGIGKSRSVLRIDGSGEEKKVKTAAGAKFDAVPRLKAWSAVTTDEYVDGSSSRYARIAGPASLSALGCPLGYAWLRATFKGSAGKAEAEFRESGDRLALYMDGAFLDMVGVGPGACGSSVTIATKAQQHSLAMLVDQLGRPCEGLDLARPDGVTEDVVELEALKVGSSKLESGETFCPLESCSPLFGVDQHDQTDSHRLTWRFVYRKKAPIVMSIEPLNEMALLIVNDEVRDVIGPHRRRHVTLDSEALRRGENVVQLAILSSMEEHAAALRKAVQFRVIKRVLSEKWAWSFATWEAPESAVFQAINKADFTSRRLAKFKGRPMWWRATFDVGENPPPLHIVASGLSKGQFFINGRNLCRYFVATQDGKGLRTQERYPIPSGWLDPEALNELLIFDEHGFGPHHVELATVK